MMVEARLQRAALVFGFAHSPLARPAPRALFREMHASALQPGSRLGQVNRIRAKRRQVKAILHGSPPLRRHVQVTGRRHWTPTKATAIPRNQYDRRLTIF